MLQGTVWDVGPRHVCPPKDGLGFVQDRVCNCSPSPQVLEQSPSSVHSVNSPSTVPIKKNKNVLENAKYRAMEFLLAITKDFSLTNPGGNVVPKILRLSTVTMHRQKTILRGCIFFAAPRNTDKPWLLCAVYLSIGY